MNIDDKSTIDCLVKTAGATLDAISGTVTPQLSGLGRILVAYGPPKLRDIILGGRLRLIQLKKQEETFGIVCNGVVAHYKKLIEKSAKQRKNSTVTSALINLSLEQLVRDIQLLSTINKALTILPNSVKLLECDQKESKDPAQECLWWDNFESIARRMNEPWRTKLLAMALVEMENDPDSISLKALWEIGMLEANDFRMLAVFCDSALLVDGRPLVLLDPDEQVKHSFEIEDGTKKVNLAYIISDLIDSRLIQKAEIQFDTTNPVELKHASGTHLLIHIPPNLKSGDDSAIQIAAFGPTDYGLDICKLYQPTPNVASDGSFRVLKSSLEEGAREDTDFGIIEFRSI